jgi:hypothetical protein
VRAGEATRGRSERFRMGFFHRQFRLKLAPECGGPGLVKLFRAEARKYFTTYCWVDALISNHSCEPGKVNC